MRGVGFLSSPLSWRPPNVFDYINQTLYFVLTDPLTGLKVNSSRVSILPSSQLSIAVNSEVLRPQDVSLPVTIALSNYVPVAGTISLF